MGFGELNKQTIHDSFTLSGGAIASTTFKENDGQDVVFNTYKAVSAIRVRSAGTDADAVITVTVNGTATPFTKTGYSTSWVEGVGSTLGNTRPTIAPGQTVGISVSGGTGTDVVQVALDLVEGAGNHATA